MGWDSSLLATKCTANQIQQGISRALNFKTTAEVQPWNALPVSVRSPAQSQEQWLSRSRRVAGIAPGHREALPILITTPQLGAKAGQVKVHAGLLPWHCNPPCSQLNRAHGQQLPLQKPAMMKASSPWRAVCLQLQEKTSLSERQFDRSQVRDKSSGPFPSHPGLSDFSICQQDMLPAF